MKASEIAELIQGTVQGNPDQEITAVNSLKLAQPNEVSFLANIKYRVQLDNTKASVVLVNQEWNLPAKEGVTFITCANPDKAFTKVCAEFAPAPQTFEAGIHPSAVVHPTAVIGEGTYVGPTAVIEQGAIIGKNTVIGAGVYVGEAVKIGDNCMIYPNVSIMRYCVLGNKLIIHAGVTIGADGFGFTPTFTGLVKVPQNGIVQIDDNVEIGANTTIDRARFGKTVIKDNVKIDDQVMVAHNVAVGESSILVAQCGIAGSAEIGRGCIIAGKAGINGHISLGDGCQVAGTSSVVKSLPAGTIAVGTPAESQREFLARVALPKKVQKLDAKIKELEAALAALSAK